MRIKLCMISLSSCNVKPRTVHFRVSNTSLLDTDWLPGLKELSFKRKTFSSQSTGRLWNDGGPKRIDPGGSSPTTSILNQIQPIPEEAACLKKDTETHGLRLVWRPRPWQEFGFRQATCYKFQKRGHIKNVFRSQAFMSASTAEKEPDESLTLITRSCPSFNKP